MKKIIFLLIGLILTYSCNKENIVEPITDYPTPLDSDFSITWEFYYKNDTEERKNWIKDIEFRNQNSIWIATYFNGIIKIEGASITEFNSNNSGLPCDTIWDMAIDDYNNLWIGTGNGLAKYDGLNWLTYNKFNSPLPVKHISSIKIDNNNVKWIGCGNADEGGLLSFDDNSWKLYTTENSILPTGIIDNIYIDDNNTIWVGTGWGIGTSGLIKIQNGSWTLYDKNNSGLPYSSVQCIASDERENMWFGMSAIIYLEPNYLHGSLVKYDGKNWEEHKPAESGKTSNRVTALSIDNLGYVWVATSGEVFDYELSLFDGKKWFVLSTKDNTFPHCFILDIKVDSNNNIWVASDKGVIKISPHY